MYPYLRFLPLLCLLFACQPNSSTKTPASAAALEDPAPPQTNYELLDTARGDLDKDGQEELVQVYNTDRPTDLGTERELIIYKQKGAQWEKWHTSSAALLPSEHGGMMGDPFHGIGIENGALVVYHTGGARYKWNYTHRYRYQQDSWQLIGANSLNVSPCVYWEELDYNLSTGQAIYKKEADNCDNEELISEIVPMQLEFIIKPTSPLTIDQIVVGNNQVQIPDTDLAMYY